MTVAALTAGGVALAAVSGSTAPSRAAATVSFSRQVQPIFDRKCAACHPVSYPYLDLRRGHAYRGLVRVSSALRPAFELVLPGRPELSYLLTHVPDPSRENLLSASETRLIARWIREGARAN